MKKKTKSKKNFNFYFYLILGGVAVVALCVGVGVKINHTDEGTNIVFGEQQVEPTFEGQGDYEDEIMTVEEIDGGGLFKDELAIEDGKPDLYRELGTIEDVDTSSPEAFKASTMGRCIIANNYYGAQCVSLARAFWWSYAGYDVSTCGTGLAKGMMNCSDENARDKFKVIWNTDEIQNGTWIVIDGTRTGHICMALGPVKNGYVSCLGENQGGIACQTGGSTTNIINLSVKNFIGGYTPLDYIIPEPEPEPAAPNTGIGQ